MGARPWAVGLLWHRAAIASGLATTPFGSGRLRSVRGCVAARPSCAAVPGIRGLATIILKSRFEDPEIPECNFAKKVMQEWPKYGDKPALIEAGSGRSVSYAQISDQVRRVASGLRKLGLKTNDIICMCSHNTVEFPVVFLAVIAVGGIVTPVNPLSTAGELRKTLMATGEATMVYCTAHTLATVQEAIAGVPNAARLKIIALDGRPEDAPSSNVIPLSALLEDDGSLYEGPVTPADCRDSIACLPFSSGTTGLPKGVMLTHYSLTANLVQLWREPIHPIKVTDTVAGLLPFFHAYGLFAVVSVALLAGASTVVYPKWDPVLFLSAIRDHKVNILQLVPPIVLFMAKDPITAQYDLSSMEHVASAAAPLGIPLAKEFLQKFPSVKSLCQGYGLTEASPASHIETRTSRRLGTAGELLPGVEARVVDIATGEDCGALREGEILLRGPNIMKGYYQNPAANAATFVDGWMKTGDVGYYDKDGFFYIVDRVKELIKYKGLQVAPAELEAILLSHPAVRDAAVVGIPDNAAGELPRAYVCLKSDHSATPEALAAFVAEFVSPYKRLRGGVHIVNEIPKSTTGKILRRVLKEQALKEKMG